MRKILAAMAISAVTMPAAAVRLDSLARGQVVNGFRVESLYLGDSSRPLGARFIHQKSGFTLDLLQIESVPQGYTWINSIPVSDQGEPHTQEHLLLGKGTKGRSFAGLDTMWLSASSAFTQQWRTSYHFNTAAGPDVFFNLLERQLDAMLHPNYTDEEIRREVRNFGVTRNPDGTRRLEEKGSVYNEMVSSTGNPYRQLFRTAGHLMYGTQHPLALNSGGEPSGIRTMQPEDIRNFHASTHYLANMGTIASFPKSVPIETALSRIDRILESVEPEARKRAAHSLETLPKPQPAPAGTIAYNEYPHRNEQQPSPLGLWWPVTRTLDLNEQILADLFFSNVAGDATTNLYKLFIDSKSRQLDIGARQIFSNVGNWGGHPIYIAFTDVTPSNFNDARVAEIRSIVTGEIARVAAFPDGSPELKEFNERIASRLTELERDLAKFINSPPRFGFRNAGSAWMDTLLALERTAAFRKSLTFSPQVAFVRGLLSSEKNFWHDYLAKWHVTGVTPYAVAARPSPSLIQREEEERAARARAEAARLMQLYGAGDEQEAIRRYQADYDAESARIEQQAAGIAPPEFVSSPPLTLDDGLQYAVRTLEGGVPLVASRFDAMTSGMTGIALRLEKIPAERLRYVSLLPVLLSRTGVIENGKPVSFEEMSERLRKEILSLDAFFATNPRTGRVELVVRGSGIGTAEALRAIDWMSLILDTPDWRPENLPRIRDVVDQSLSALRNTMQGSEESWVNNPATAWRMQHHPTHLAADSFLTRSHNALRLRWLLKEVHADDRDAVVAWFDRLAGAAVEASRDELKATLGRQPQALSPAAQSIVADAVRDLDLTLIEIPEGSLAADWSYLVQALRDDLLTPPAAALASLEALRRQIVTRANARTYMVGSAEMEKALTARLTTLVKGLAAPGTTITLTSGEAAPASRHVEARLRQRVPNAEPVHAGLFSPNKPGGVIITSVPAAHFSDFDDREKQLDFLASRLHAGYGAHGIFLKTIGAGLAYSNGLRATVTSGRMGYYAERTPELPQTVHFVVNELKSAARDPRLADYAVAQVFSPAENRAAAGYEARAEGIAADLADEQPPDMVRRFRRSILELRKDPRLGDILFDRKDRVYGRFIPGYNGKAGEVPGGIFFVVGPDKQLDAWEEYLKAVEGPEARLYRVDGRDFWMP
ncbi:MAG TPA: hypothetical protein VNA04_18045 [Thermoanaerobaculia bacterium]|nr:hypothetical protein [Thermoanaerobaculia bacterium]